MELRRCGSSQHGSLHILAVRLRPLLVRKAGQRAIVVRRLRGGGVAHVDLLRDGSAHLQEVEAGGWCGRRANRDRPAWVGRRSRHDLVIDLLAVLVDEIDLGVDLSELQLSVDRH